MLNRQLILKAIIITPLNLMPNWPVCEHSILSIFMASFDKRIKTFLIRLEISRKLCVSYYISFFFFYTTHLCIPFIIHLILALSPYTTT